MVAKAPILYEKTYYEPVFFDNSRDRDGKETGDFSGTLLTRIYRIKKYKNGVRLVQDTDVVSFSGVNRAEMEQALVDAVQDMSELPKEAEDDRGYVPPTVKEKFNNLKYGEKPVQKNMKKKQTQGDTINAIFSSVDKAKQKNIDEIVTRLNRMSPTDVAQLKRIIKA